MQFGTVENGKLKLDKTGLTIIVAIIAIVPPLVGSLNDAFVKPKLQYSTMSIDRAKLDLERRKTAVALYQTALANPDATQRQSLVRFLIAAGLLDSANVIGLPADQIPYWPAASSTPR